MQLTLRSYDSLADLEQLRANWDELLENYPCATTFSTWEWLSAWWNNFRKGRDLIALALFDSGRLAGLASFSTSKEQYGWFAPRVLRLLGDGTFDSDNLDIPVLPGYQTIFAQMVVEYLVKRKREWDVCLLNTLPSASLVGNSLEKVLGTSSWSLFTGSPGGSAVDLPETWDEYLQLLSSEDRKNLVRYTRRLQSRYSMRVYRCKDEGELVGRLAALFRLHQGRWEAAGQPGTFSSTARREFYLQLSQNLLARGELELWVLELDGDIAAVQFAFRYRNRVFQLQEGYDHRRSSDRPGFVLRGHVLKQLISANVRTYDFLGGEDSYKSRWGAQPTRYRQLCFAPKWGPGAALLHTMDKSSRGKEWLRQSLPTPVWTALHDANVFLRKRREGDMSSKTELEASVVPHAR